jgi:hypothetical protein
MIIHLKHESDVFQIDTKEQTYSIETYDKKLFDLLFCNDSEESYFESNPDSTCYSGWGNYGDHGEEFVTILFQNLGVWFSYYAETVEQFVKQVDDFE